MSCHARRILPPSASRKRKELEPFGPSTTSPKPSAKPTSVTPPVSFNRAAATASFEPRNPVSSNRLLAGYMAHEFLAKGTLFGEKFDPDRAGAVSNSTRGAQPKPSGYADVANLLKAGGAHVPGVVNPTQLAKWMRDVEEEVLFNSSQDK